MLNGDNPVIIFQFSLLAGTKADVLSKIPIVSQIPTVIDQPPIPLYLSRELTGFIVGAQSKNVDIETETQTKADGTEPDVNQKGIQSGVTVNLEARRDSIGVLLLGTLIDVGYDKATSKEYAITYINGPIVIFRGLLHSFSLEEDPGTDLVKIKLELSRGSKNPKKDNPVKSVAPKTDAVVLGGAPT